MSEALTSLLDSAGSPDRAAREIADTPALLSEAKAALPALRDLARAKAGADGVKAVIGRRLALYPQPQRSEAEAAAWWADYYDVLEDIALVSLEAAMRAYVALPDSEFMPKPGKLRDLAATTPSRSLQRFYRATRAIQFAEEPPLSGTDGERVRPDEVKAMLAEFQARTVADVKLQPALPSIAGKVDETGITQQMRDLMSRREGQ